MLTQKQIIEAIHTGSLTAAEKYEEWSRGWTIFDSGVEGILVAGIAEALHDSQGNSGSLLLEVPFKYIQEYSGASRPPGRPRNTLKGTNRMDIVLFDDQDRPIYAIEVKRTWIKDQCFKDLKRIRDLVVSLASPKGGSLRRGFLTMLLQDSDMKGEISKSVRDQFPHNRVKFFSTTARRKERSDLVPFSIEISSPNA